MTATDIIPFVRRRLARAGLLLRGGFHPRAGDGVPHFADGRPTRSLLLVGNAGRALWRRLAGSPETTRPHPFDTYCRRVLGELADACGARAVFPDDGPPWYPFQRWAMRAEPGLRPSPLGILLHPRFGPWHAYRGALLFARRFPLDPPARFDPPCTHCTRRPCLDACPAGALGADGYDIARCRAHLRGHPHAECMERGCLARHACPVGRPFAQEPAQASHHMRAFVTPAVDRACRGSAPDRGDSAPRPPRCPPNRARRD